MLRKVKAMWERFTGVEVLRWHLADAWRAVETKARWHNEAMLERDAARDERDAGRAQCERLQAELDTAKKSACLHRALIAILRDVNRDLDERNTYLEQLHAERLAPAVAERAGEA